MGSGRFAYDAVGESHYQRVLEVICGKKYDPAKGKIVEATLVHEDNNQYDSMAVRVDIFGHTVGYLSREQARVFRETMARQGHAGAEVVCPAKIVGGWYQGGADRASFGVKLDLPIASGQSAKVPSAPAGTTLTFDLQQPNLQQLQYLEPGERVKLWAPADEPSRIFVFRSGTVGGEGKLGLVPEALAEVIAKHRARQLPIEAMVVQFSSEGCTVECSLLSKDEPYKGSRKSK
jgi:hypothetical protein